MTPEEELLKKLVMIMLIMNKDMLNLKNLMIQEKMLLTQLFKNLLKDLTNLLLILNNLWKILLQLKLELEKTPWITSKNLKKKFMFFN